MECHEMSKGKEMSAEEEEWEQQQQQLEAEGVQSVSGLKQIHARLLLLRSQPSSSSYTCTSTGVLSRLLCLPLSLAALSYAHSLVLSSSTPARRTRCFNLLLRALSSPSSPWHSPLLALRSLPLPSLFDSFTFPSLFRACSSLPNLPLALSAHALALKLAFLRHPHTVHSLITLYSNFSLPAPARNLFDQIPLSDRDLVSWNSIISAYVRTGFPNQAMRLFNQMLFHGWQPNHVTLLPILTACRDLGDLSTAKWIEATFLTYTNIGSFLASALIDMYAKCGVLDDSRRVFDSIHIHQKDVCIWNSMITGYAQNGMANQAIALFHTMTHSNVNPNKITLVGVLSACASVGALDLGKQLDTYALNNGLYANVFVGTALIDMYGKCGHLDSAIQVFDKMPHKNDATWNALISALALNGRGRHAIRAFYQMIEQGIPPDDITFICVLSACVHAGMVQEGRQWFHRMQVQYRISPKKEHYSCMVDLLARAGHVEEAWGFIEQMGDKADSVVLGALLAGCRKRKCLQVGEKVIEKLLEIEPSKSWNYMVSSRMYEVANRLDDSARMRVLMRERGVTKTPGCSWIEISGEVHEFYAGDELHLRVGDIYQIIDLLICEMKLEGYVPNTEL